MAVYCAYDGCSQSTACYREANYFSDWHVAGDPSVFFTLYTLTLHKKDELGLGRFFNCI